jgi:serine protease Do
VELAPFALDRDAFVERLRGATVEIWSKRGHGAGIRWPTAGLVVTCSHVVTGRTSGVRLGDGAEHEGRLLLDEPESDIALLMLDEPLEPPAIEVRRTPLRPGELLFAMGNPWGEARVLTSGIAMGNAGDGRLVAADLRVAPGNSGGPLVDAEGRLAGVVSMYRGGAAVGIAAHEVERLIALLDSPASAA